MRFDLAAILLFGTALTGSVWLCHRVLVGRSDTLTAPPGGLVRREPRIVEYSRILFPVAFVVLIVRSFVFEPYRIPSPSMVPTLLVGDFILVSKFSYGLRLPVFDLRIMATGTPSRGDVVVFRLPSNPSVNYIKRVIGLPGDRIAYRDHALYVNGVKAKVVLSGEAYVGTGAPGAELGSESLDGRAYPILHDADKHPVDQQDFEQTVPAGHYFMMGDNRDNSQDSRSAQVGFVPEQNLVGKAVRIWLNSNDLGRAGDTIR